VPNEAVEPWAAYPDGLSYGTVAVVATSAEWADAGSRLAAALRDALPEDAVAVEHVGSTSIPGLLAKPILDLAVALAPTADRAGVVAALEGVGFEFRGDAGNAGGLVFVLESQPGHRVAHLHAVGSDDPQWAGYLPSGKSSEPILGRGTRMRR
jgi:GrpB-like predicted nucleotidyltransferase (UPF0157 family)